MNRHLLERIYNVYASEIKLYLYSLCESKAQAEDIMHDTFVKALLSLSDEHPNFRAWLYQVAHNLCINEMRKRRRLQTEYNGRMNKCIGEADILNHILKNEKYRTLYKSIISLPYMQREVLFLFYFGELKTGEIAEVMDVTPENVRVIMYRGRVKLRRLLEEEGYHEF